MVTFNIEMPDKVSKVYSNKSLFRRTGLASETEVTRESTAVPHSKRPKAVSAITHGSNIIYTLEQTLELFWTEIE